MIGPDSQPARVLSSQDCSERLWLVECPDLLGMPFFFGAGLFILASTSAAHAFPVVRGSTPGKHGARADSKHAPPFAPGAHTGDEDVPLLT